jgi:hypothetical protein
VHGLEADLVLLKMKDDLSNCDLLEVDYLYNLKNPEDISDSEMEEQIKKDEENIELQARLSSKIFGFPSTGVYVRELIHPEGCKEDDEGYEAVENFVLDKVGNLKYTYSRRFTDAENW